jgi:hypothetical protein
MISDTSKKRGFLKPLGIAIAALLATATNQAMANTNVQTTVEKANQNFLNTNSEYNQITLEPPVRNVEEFAWHGSHSSHSSHSSHVSHYSSRY